MTRYPQLDGLRGWLSLMVVFSHVAAFRWMPLPDAGAAPDRLTWVLWNLGAPSVDAFFVLSGLVVSQSLENRPRSYGQYLAGRARRLLPMGVVGLLLALPIRWLGPSLPPGGIHDFVTTPLTTQDWAGILTLGLLPFTADSLNPPLWSLIIEQHMALLMPVLMLAVKRGLSVIIPTVVTCLVLGLVFYYPLYALWFVPAFLTGIAIRDVRLPQKTLNAALIAGLILWQHRQFTGDHFLYRQTAMLGAALIIVSLLSLPVSHQLRRTLEHPISQFLGCISYPLYATHFAVLSAAAALSPGHAFLATLLSIPAALLLATALWKYIDHPLTTWRPALRPRPGETGTP